MSKKPDAIVLTDALGDELRLGGPAKRIVSLVPSISESLIELGAGGTLVGITNYCVHPAAAVASIAKVGGTKGFAFDKIAALTPDLIIANKEENRKHHIDKLRESYPVFVTYPRTVGEAIDMVGDLGTLTGTVERAQAFAAAYQEIISRGPPGQHAAPLRTACLIWRDPWMAAGPGTYMSDLLETVGFQIVFTDDDGRYPETTLEAIIERTPQVIILPDEPYEFAEKDQKDVERVLVEKGHRARVVLMDGSYLTWFGTRTLPGLRYLHGLRRELLE